MLSQHTILQDMSQEKKDSIKSDVLPGVEDFKPFYKTSLSLSDENVPKELQQSIIDPTKLSMGSLICEGTEGDVFSGLLTTEQDKKPVQVAIKIPILRYYQDKDNSIQKNKANKAIQEEARTMRILRSPYTVECLGIYEYKPSLYAMVMPFYPSNLHQRLKKSPLAQLEQVTFALGLSRALHWIHSNKYIHGDLKSTNILIDIDGGFKIGGYGINFYLGTKKMRQRH